MVKEETVYSIPWRAVKIIANIIVYNKPYKEPLLFPCIKAWWAYVTVTPEDNKITVFNKGNSNGFIALIPIGGHLAPSSIVGAKALWKKAQNIAKKKSASDIINNPTPILIPLCTANVWLPKNVPSEITSLNHKLILYTKHKSANNKTLREELKLWKLKTALNVTASKLKLVNKGQGLGDTRW